MLSQENKIQHSFRIFSLTLALTHMIIFGVLFSTAKAAVITVGVTSNKEVKIKPVRDAFQALFPNDQIEIHPFKADSQIADQPVTEASGILGAKNRISHSKNILAATANGPTIHYWVSIENFIAPSNPANPEEKWVDIGAVVIEDVDTQEIDITLSDPVSLDSHFAKSAQDQTDPTYAYFSTGYSITSGKVIKADYATRGIEIDDGNWHIHPDFGGVSRADILGKAVLIAVQKMKDQIKK